MVENQLNSLSDIHTVHSKHFNPHLSQYQTCGRRFHNQLLIFTLSSRRCTSLFKSSLPPSSIPHTHNVPFSSQRTLNDTLQRTLPNRSQPLPNGNKSTTSRRGTTPTFSSSDFLYSHELAWPHSNAQRKLPTPAINPPLVTIATGTHPALGRCFTSRISIRDVSLAGIVPGLFVTP